MPVSAFILAGEASGDRLAAQLMAAAKEVFPGISWFGIGGEKMQKAGLISLGGMDSLSIIGFGESLASFRALSR
ncbi:MAG: lipid-A-disaccharide synthase, partial [Candidatus Puniceispirillaceae bacterium]